MARSGSQVDAERVRPAFRLTFPSRDVRAFFMDGTRAFGFKTGRVTGLLPGALPHHYHSRCGEKRWPRRSLWPVAGCSRKSPLIMVSET